MAATTFFAQQAANRRNSFLLAVLVSLLLGALGFAIGYALTGDSTGGVGTTVIALVIGIVEIGRAHV